MITINYSEFFSFLVACSGYMIIYCAIDLNRPNDKIKLWSTYWWLSIILVVIGTIIIKDVDKWFS